MIEIDGNKKSGSGTILRLSISLASILGEELHIYNIRKRRRLPGLRPQHLESVLIAAKLCNAKVKGTTLGSEELWFKPSEIIGGEIEAQIGTAGSIPMLLMTILPICAFAKKRTHIHVNNGGTSVRYSPTINYLQYILLPMLEKMGLKTQLTIHKYGYYPRGMGEISLTVQPCKKLSALYLPKFGKTTVTEGFSVCTFLKNRKVADRQAKSATQRLRDSGYDVQIKVVYDSSNPHQKGSSIVLFTQTDCGTLLGVDEIGERGKSSEVVGHNAAEKLLNELKAKATVDIHLADMLIPYIALADGNSVFLTRSMTNHLSTNIWLTQKILNVKFQVKKSGKLYRVEKHFS
ncbi:RNA 3'-terminal phosphate cyclase [Candidatus Bathyarchaeota archaeon]|nr:RNA 3'-terminal phosphate cyclase [Candidatus Bathyarchaeota archaeon]